jgi:hypothetical protein
MHVNDRPRILFHKGNKIASVGRSAAFDTSSETLSDAGVMTRLEKGEAEDEGRHISTLIGFVAISGWSL